MLLIRKMDKVKLNSVIGRIFRSYNVFIYKSPDEEMDIRAYFEGNGYCYLVKSDEMDTPLDEITLSLVHWQYPTQLFDDLEEKNIHHEKKYPGIYYLSGNITFPTQVIVTNELDTDMDENLIWLKSLRRGLSEEEIEKLHKEAMKYEPGTEERENAETVIKTAERADRQ